MHSRTAYRSVVVAVATTMACQIGAADAAPAVQATFVDPGTPEQRSVRDVGERAIDRLAYTMVAEILSSVAREGPPKAVASAHLKNLATNGGALAGYPRITAVKLTSAKLRNPANAPDPADTLALDRVQSDLEAGVSPTVLVQRVENPGGAPEWRVYKPLAALKGCLACHGPADTQSPELQAALHARYPSDQAVDYQAGQLRGLFRVTVAEPAPPKTIPSAPPKGAKKS